MDKKIYHVKWDYSGFGLNAVVIAGGESEAEFLLDLDPEETTEVVVTLLGIPSSRGNKSRVVVEESL